MTVTEETARGLETDPCHRGFRSLLALPARSSAQRRLRILATARVDVMAAPCRQRS